MTDIIHEKYRELVSNLPDNRTNDTSKKEKIYLVKRKEESFINLKENKNKIITYHDIQDENLNKIIEHEIKYYKQKKQYLPFSLYIEKIKDSKEFFISKELEEKIDENLHKALPDDISSTYFVDEFISMVKRYKLKIYTNNYQEPIILFTPQGKIDGFFARAMSKRIVFTDSAITSEIYASLYTELKVFLEYQKNRTYTLVKYTSLVLEDNGNIVFKLNT